MVASYPNTPTHTVKKTYAPPAAHRFTILTPDQLAPESRSHAHVLRARVGSGATTAGRLGDGDRDLEQGHGGRGKTLVQPCVDGRRPATSHGVPTRIHFKSGFN